MVEIKQTLVGKLESKSSLSGKLNNAIEKVYPELEDLVVTPSSEEQIFTSTKYGFDEVKLKGVEIKEHYLDGSYLVLVVNDNSTLRVDISEYIGELNDETIEAINNMKVSMENDELVLEYNDTVLNLDFSIENGELIVDDNVEEADFNINQNGEMEVSY